MLHFAQFFVALCEALLKALFTLFKGCFSHLIVIEFMKLSKFCDFLCLKQFPDEAFRYSFLLKRTFRNKLWRKVFFKVLKVNFVLCVLFKDQKPITINGKNIYYPNLLGFIFLFIMCPRQSVTQYHYLEITKKNHLKF
jgi:hypothetical protein